MKKLNFAIVIACIVTLASCGGGNKNKYVVNGIVPDSAFNGKFVYMSDLNDGQIIDSAKIADGKFVFNGVADSAMARMLSVGDFAVDLIVDKGVITLDMSDETKAKGTPITEAYGAFMLKRTTAMTDVNKKLQGVDSSLPDSVKESVRDSIINGFIANMNELSQSYLNEHPNDALGAMVFYIWMKTQKKPSSDVFNKACQSVGDNVRDFGPVKKMAAFFESLEKTEEGKPFVDFTIENGNVDGTSVSLSDYVGKGKYVLVDFWASWCKPCRMETPNIAEVYKKYKGDKFDVVSVAVWDKRENTLEAIKEDGNTWPQILDAKTIPTDLYGIRGIPHIILFGPDGTIVARNLRGGALKAKVAEVMSDK